MSKKHMELACLNISKFPLIQVHRMPEQCPHAFAVHVGGLVCVTGTTAKAGLDK